MYLTGGYLPMCLCELEMTERDGPECTSVL